MAENYFTTSRNVNKHAWIMLIDKNCVIFLCVVPDGRQKIALKSKSVLLVSLPPLILNFTAIIGNNPHRKLTNEKIH